MRSTAHEEDGFTLVEVLIAMITASLIITAVSAAIIVAAETTGLVSARLSQTDDRQLVEIYLPRDTASAQAVEDSTTNGGTPPIATCAKDQHVTTTPTAVLILKGTSEIFTTQGGTPKITYEAYEADYVVARKLTSNSPKTHSHGKRLIRYYCSTQYAYTPTNLHGTHVSCASPAVHVCTAQTVSYDLWSKTTRTVQPAVATVRGTQTRANRTIVTLTLTDPTRNRYSVTGVERS